MALGKGRECTIDPAAASTHSHTHSRVCHPLAVQAAAKQRRQLQTACSYYQKRGQHRRHGAAASVRQDGAAAAPRARTRRRAASAPAARCARRSRLPSPPDLSARTTPQKQAHPELQLFCNDWCYVRFLRARGWSLAKAEAMLRATLEWCALRCRLARRQQPPLLYALRCFVCCQHDCAPLLPEMKR